MSLRLRLLTLVLRLSAKPYLRRIEHLERLRGDSEHFAGLFLRPPPFTLALPLRLGGVPVLSIRSGRARRGAAVLFFHGGAHLAGSPWTHFAMLARLARLGGVEVLVPDYRLAPEHPYPAALDDAEAVWQALQARGYAATELVLGGDSSGGGLALSLLARLCAQGTPPAGLIAFSPWVDLTGAGASVRENARRDPMLAAERMAEAAQHYLQGVPADTPGASPLFAEFPACPPVLLQCSETEILRDDSFRMAERLRRFGAEVTLQCWPDAPHVWQMFDGFVPEAREALRAAAGAVQAMLSAPPRASGGS